MKEIKSEFYQAVQCGREIEFRYHDKHYFESRNHDKDWYIYCEETKEEQHFQSSEALLLNARFEDKNINDIWEHIIIDCIL